MTPKHTAAKTDGLAPPAEWVATTDLVRWAGNPRKNKRAVERVAASITAFGFGAPLLARKANRELIAGHTRLLAAESLGIELLPVRFMDLTEAQAHALALADNKLGEIAQWDDALLAETVARLAASDEVSLACAGFASHEVEKLLKSIATKDESGGSAATETVPDRLREKWKTELGQVWEIPSVATKGGVHRIVCGSSTEAEVVAKVAREPCAMMWTDPPYGVSYTGKTKDVLTIQNDATSPEALHALLIQAFAAAPLVPGAAWYIAHPAGELSVQFASAIASVGWRYRQGLVWLKDSMVLGRSDYHYIHEPIMYGFTAGGKGRRGRGGDSWHGGNAEVSVFEVPRPKANPYHPTMKPVELVARMIRNSSKPGARVYEPFSGSGTTVLACEETGRLCAAVELDPKYVAVALERMAEAGCHGKLSEA